MLLVILLFSSLLMPNHSSAVGGKIASEAAKKVAKEVAKDVAIDMTYNMVMNYTYVPKDERYKAKEGYTMICLPKDKKPGGDCAAPVQIKKNITRADLGPAVERQLEKKIAGGVTSTKWGKFVNWFVPIFAAGLGYAVIDYSFNGDVSDLFDEIAMDALKDEGLLLTTEDTGEPASSLFTKYNTVRSTNGNKYYIEWAFTVAEKHKDYQYYDKDALKWVDFNVARFVVGSLEYQWNRDLNEWVFTSFGGLGQQRRTINQVIIGSLDSPSNMGKVKDLMTDPQTRRKPKPLTAPSGTPSENGVERTRKAGSTVPIPGPGSIPLRTNDGAVIYPSVQPDGSIIYKTQDGTEVDESAVVVLEPQIQENPDGSKKVVQQPTWENQNPNQDGEIPPGQKPPGEEGEQFPEGQTCNEHLKLPKLSALFRQMSDSFPFSIPWDIKSAFDAVFSGIGTGIPKVNWSISAFGNKYDLSFEIPKQFADFQPFLHSVVLIFFDIGMLLLIHRLIKGGG